MVGRRVNIMIAALLDVERGHKEQSLLEQLQRMQSRKTDNAISVTQLLEKYLRATVSSEKSGERIRYTVGGLRLLLAEPGDIDTRQLDEYCIRPHMQFEGPSE